MIEIKTVAGVIDSIRATAIFVHEQVMETHLDGPATAQVHQAYLTTLKLVARGIASHTEAPKEFMKLCGFEEAE